MLGWARDRVHGTVASELGMSHCAEVCCGYARKTIRCGASRMRGMHEGNTEVRGDGRGGDGLRAALLRPRVLREMEDRRREGEATRRNRWLQVISSPSDHCFALSVTALCFVSDQQRALRELLESMPVGHVVLRTATITPA